MAAQDLIWIALPNGLGASGRARLSVYLTPHLQPDADRTLAPFDFVDWPARLRPDRFQLDVLLDGVTAPATVVSEPDSSIWRALFPPEVFVRPFRPDETLGLFGTYPAARLHDLIKRGYQEMFDRSPTAPGPVPEAFTELLPLFGPPEADPGRQNADPRSALARDVFRRDGQAASQARLDQLVDLARQDAQHRRDGGEAFAPTAVVPDAGDGAAALAQFAVFHRQPAGTAEPGEAVASDTELDFHQHVASLGEYPALLRLLGIVIDVEFDASAIPAAAGTVMVVPRFLAPTSAPITHHTPRTAYTTESATAFAARPSLPETVAGLVNLRLRAGPDGSDPVYRIVQVDVDAATLQAAELLQRAEREAARSNTGTPSSSIALPALRSAGVSIVRAGYGGALFDRIGDGLRKLAAMTAGQAVTLFADDLIRGYRVDIHDVAAGRWLSLHSRDGTYTFPAAAMERVLTDEGFVQPSVVQPSPASGARSSAHDPTAPSYISESLFLWNGWSLAAPRPGQVLPNPGEAGREPVAVQIGRLEVAFRVGRGRLPRLRFGRRYEVRARTVDLAGNGLTVEEADRVLDAMPQAERPVLPEPGEQFHFCRFEPVLSPVVIPRAPNGGGESADRLVLRSNHDATVEEYAARHPQRSWHRQSAERHLLPPKVSQHLAEMLGLFEASIGTGADLARTYGHVRRAERDLPNDVVLPEPAVTVPYLPDPLAGGVTLRSLPGVPPGMVGRFIDGTLSLTEAPIADSAVLIDFTNLNDWPDVGGVRLRLAEGSTAPVWDPGEALLTVFLPKGESATIRVSCHLAVEDGIELFGPWRWANERLQALAVEGHADRLRRLAGLGLCWQLTSYRELTLVHAVQQPARAPAEFTLTPVRLTGRTFAYLQGRVRVHGASTGRLDLLARWTDLRDDHADQTRPPAPVPFSSQVYAAPIVLPSPGASATARGTEPIASYDPETDLVEFVAPDLAAIHASVVSAANDLKAACVALVRAARLIRPPKPTAVARARSVQNAANDGILQALQVPAPEGWERLAHFGRSLAIDVQPPPAGFEGEDPDFPFEIVGQMIAVGLAAEDCAKQAESAVAELDRYPGRHEFSDTRHREVTYQVVATTRYGDCFPTQGEESLPLTRSSEPVTVDVPSSAHPPPPHVRYSVPAFAWQRWAGPGTEIHSTRKGGILRLYLERPWYVSGNGEMLGVLLRPTPPPPSADLDAITTRWGRDPLWLTAATSEAPGPGDFRNPARVDDQVALDESPSATRVTVVAYDVRFDDQGNCYSDIEVDPGLSYFPFIRLALARYQPKSLPGLALSDVVLADYAQLTPDRSVVTVRTPSGVAVTVSGITHDTAPDPKTLARTGTWVRAGIQERIPGTADDAGWSDGGHEPVELTREGSGEQARWHGTVPVPTDRKPGELRLLIEELETYQTIDPESGDRDLRHRVVFADVMPL